MVPANCNILIVDDLEVNLLILENMVQSMGHHAVTAANGEDALTAIETSHPDLILLDIVLPGIDGYEVLEFLKGDPVLCNIPVIMISSLGETDSVVKCIQLGAEDYITRPFTIPLLMARVNGVLEKQQASLKAERLGRYTLDVKIGDGGMADVYLAQHVLLRRPTAVKVLKREMISEENLAMFEHEVQITSTLAHPNTIVIFDYGRTPDCRFYYAMEYLDGISLQTLIDFTGPIPEGRVVHILKQVCGSLSEAHSKDLIHRDIKPSNIMLCNRGGEFDVVKVLDFGIVQTIQEHEDSSDDSFVMGTPAYIPPEALQDGKSMDGRSDLYSLALVGYFLLTGTSPFNLASIEKSIYAQVNDIPKVPSEILGQEISPDLEHLILKCLEKDITNRPANARTLYDSLDQCQHVEEWTRIRAEEWWKKQDFRRTSPSSEELSSEASIRTLSIDLMSPRTQSLLEQSP